MKLKYFTIKDIRSWKPCYNPSMYLKEDFKGTALTILNNEDIPFADRLWVVLRSQSLSEKALRLFTIWCYRQTLEFITNPDPRSVKAVDVAEAYALGKATKEELDIVAYDAAHAAYCSAPSSSAAASAVSVAYCSAPSSSATFAAAFVAAFATIYYSASVPSDKNKYKDKLIEMVLEEGKQKLERNLIWQLFS